VFVSFFPQPKQFFLSAIGWSVVVVLFWFFVGEDMGAWFGLPPADPEAPPIIGIASFWSKPFLWFYLYFATAVLLFYSFWSRYSPHPWQNWSILGSSLILFITYFQVQVSVAVNNWYGPFWDYVQGIMSKTLTTTTAEFYSQLSSFVWLALVGMNVSVLTAFFVSHWIFRWRTAMNDYYMANWARLRHIEGASQRVQEDTMRFSQIMEGLGVAFIDSIMTLIAFMPVLVKLSEHVTETAAGRAHREPAGRRLDRLVAVRDVCADHRRLQASRPAVPQPARRGCLPQGTRLWRGRCHEGAAADGQGTVRKRQAQLFPALFPLRLFQRRPLHLPAGQQHLLAADSGALHCCGTDQPGAAQPDHVCVLAGVELLPVPGELLVDDRRAAVRSQAPQGLRGGDRRRRASGDRQAVSGKGSAPWRGGRDRRIAARDGPSAPGRDAAALRPSRPPEPPGSRRFSRPPPSMLRQFR